VLNLAICFLGYTESIKLSGLQRWSPLHVLSSTLCFKSVARIELSYRRVPLSVGFLWKSTDFLQVVILSNKL